ncbi:carbohydrate ABC transporter permease [Paenibacillus thalictri]|nr:sugar ABC transporter permease [Paenibacillus thalictri]
MNKQEKLLGYLFIAPNLIGITVFMLIPCLFAFALCFMEWNHMAGLAEMKFVGLEKFAQLAGDETFWKSLKNNVMYTVIGVPLAVALALIVSVVLNDKVFIQKTLRAMFFIPYVTNGIAVAFVWMLLYEPRRGPLNGFLKAFGVDNPPMWLASTKWALPALIIIYIWSHIGFNTIIYLAHLQGIPRDLYEAAEVDGAKGWQKFTYITFPLLSPGTFFLLVTGIIGSFKVFGIVNALTQGGPGDSTTVLGYYIYTTAFRFYDMGYASVMSLVLFVMIMIVTVIQWQGQKRWVHY